MPEELMSTLAPLEAYRLWAAAYPPRPHNAVMLAEERAVKALLPASLAGFNVLDAGCGSGRLLLLAKQRGASYCVGIDLTMEMLLRAMTETEIRSGCRLARATMTGLPVRSRWAELSLSGMAIGHVPAIRPALAEMRRVTMPGGRILVSDFHPVGHDLGWKRTFRANGRRYAVDYTPHHREEWLTSCADLGLEIEGIEEPYLDPADIPAGARFDAAALEQPVALVVAMRRP
ncbi:MAG TPA: methyltransferase domain-containing protein [Chthonomonadales bacterium]|nr:methyltransferase domain-containing protein [Chthonomonadales bacterium]